MKKIIGMSKKVLEVDLTNESFIISTVPDKDIKMYLGGKGLGLKLIYDRITPGIDPLGEENIIAFMTGALLGTAAPCTSRFSAVTKTPLTPELWRRLHVGGLLAKTSKPPDGMGFLLKESQKIPCILLSLPMALNLKTQKISGVKMQ